jgi:hypothetical protein
MADLQRDCDQLCSMAAALTSLKQTFADMAGSASEEKPIFGHDKVGKAYNGFATNWSEARTKLSGQIDGAVQALSGVTAVYDGLEADIVASTQPNGAAAPPGNGSPPISPAAG